MKGPSVGDLQGLQGKSSVESHWRVSEEECYFPTYVAAVWRRLGMEAGSALWGYYVVQMKVKVDTTPQGIGSGARKWMDLLHTLQVAGSDQLMDWTWGWQDGQRWQGQCWFPSSAIGSMWLCFLSWRSPGQVRQYNMHNMSSSGCIDSETSVTNLQVHL